MNSFMEWRWREKESEKNDDLIYVGPVDNLLVAVAALTDLLILDSAFAEEDDMGYLVLKKHTYFATHGHFTFFFFSARKTSIFPIFTLQRRTIWVTWCSRCQHTL